jgi:nucleotide-binding universal stress UspA family protein
MGANPIIVAVDPHRTDTAGAALGLLLARIAGAPLQLVSVYTSERAEAQAAVETVRAETARLAEDAVRVTSTVLRSEHSPAAAIQRLAAQQDARLIVVGSSARGTVGRVMPGAVTDRLLHGAPCAVAVAPAGFAADRLQLIGVGFVDRPDGRAALAFANDLAARSGALVRVLTVREPVDWRVTAPLAAAELAAVQRMRDEAADRTAQAGDDAVPKRHSGGRQILGGSPQDGLAAASADFDLLVCGSRGHGPARSLILGGVSHALVREAACPVIVVPLADPEEAVA